MQLQQQLNKNSAGMTLLERVDLALAEFLPAMTADGGGVKFISLVDGVLTLQFIGSCLFCPSQKLSAAALKLRMQERVPELGGIELISISPPISMHENCGISIAA